MKKLLLILVFFLLSLWVLSQTLANTTKKYCWDGQEKLNSQGNFYCDWNIGASSEKKSEYSSSTTCDWYYKTYVYKTNNKLTGIFIKNWKCKWAARSFTHVPSWWISEECKRWGWTWNYKWTYAKDDTYAWATTWVVCEVEIDNSFSGSSNDNIDLNTCPDVEAKVCWKKWSYYSKVRKTYKNMCFLIKDWASYVAPWECKLRDEKWCLVDTYKWCSTLKRCLKTTKYCPSSNYEPNLDSATKGVLNPLVTDFINKIQIKFSDNEKRLQVIDKLWENIDKIIYMHSKYKDILYYILQKIEAKRVDYLN